MEPERQIEIQLGHMCNNRCVFCVSGQRTAMREALPIAPDPIVEKLREARARGIEKVTLLGGEPTIQPGFFDILRATVDLGFEEIVIFTNGVKTARASFVDEILATAPGAPGRFTFRLSFQGGDARAHERTTKKLGSFARLVESLANLRARGQRVTVNMCVVRSNYESVAAFPALLLPYGVTQLHLDMIRPLDAGTRTEDEMRAMLPRYSDLVPALQEMIAGFPPGFDVNIGNLPYCVAPELAPFIHHDGNETLTVAVDNEAALSEPWDKYAVKRRDKLKLDSCRSCVFDARCSGVFDTYRRFHGVDELVPITRARLPIVDPERRLLTLHLEPCIDALRDMGALVHVDSHAERVSATLDGVSFRLDRPGLGPSSTDRFSLHLVSATVEPAPVLRRVLARLCDVTGAKPIDPRIGVCLARLHDHAPFPELTWRSATLGGDGRSASVELRHRDGIGVTLAFAVHGEGVRGGYRLDRAVDAPPPGLVAGVRAAMSALRATK